MLFVFGFYHWLMCLGMVLFVFIILGVVKFLRSLYSSLKSDLGSFQLFFSLNIYSALSSLLILELPLQICCIFDIVPGVSEALVKFSSIILFLLFSLILLNYLFTSLILSSVISNLLLSKSSVLIIVFFNSKSYICFFLYFFSFIEIFYLLSHHHISLISLETVSFNFLNIFIIIL